MAVFSGNGAVGSPSFTFSSDTDTGMYRIGVNSLGLATGGVSALQIDSAQNVDITPTDRLRVYGRITPTDGVRFMNISATTANGAVFDTAGTAIPMSFSIGNGSTNIERLRLDSAGNILAGGTLPASYQVRISTAGDILVGGTLPSSPNASLSVNGNFTSNKNAIIRGEGFSASSTDISIPGLTSGYFYQILCIAVSGSVAVNPVVDVFIVGSASLSGSGFVVQSLGGGGIFSITRSAPVSNSYDLTIACSDGTRLFRSASVTRIA